MEMLTKILARHVYNLDLNDLPLDRLSDQKTRRTRRGMSKTDMNPVQVPQDIPITNNKQNEETQNVPDGTIPATSQRLTRSLSEANLQAARGERASTRRSIKIRRSKSLGK